MLKYIYFLLYKDMSLQMKNKCEQYIKIILKYLKFCAMYFKYSRINLFINCNLMHVYNLMLH